MKLTRFTATNVHGFLPLQILFKDKLTFLTGINGSGKTTALNLIVALITPNLATLQNVEFNKATIEFIDSQKSLFISATKDGDSVTISASDQNETFSYSRYLGDPNASTSRRIDLESEYYREMLSISSSNQVLRFIASLPTPMFLGLDRRAHVADEDRTKAYPPRLRTLAERNLFSGSSAGSLSDAIELAESAYKDVRFSSYKVGEDLKRSMLLGLLTFSPETFNSFKAPTSQEVKDLNRVSADLDELPAIFNLPKAEVEKRVAPFVAALQKIVARIPLDANISTLLGDGSSGKIPPVINDIVKWSSNRSQLKRIMVISEIVSSYNERQTAVMEPIEKYKGLVNKFLKDSGKAILLDDRGNIQIKIEGIDAAKPMPSLSSGEAQIFVILTQLSFNESAHKANVFIIDEPELSLHVHWQELFVDSVLSANDQIQFIMATHSPSIILDRLSNCIDMSKQGKVANRRGKV